MTTPASRQPAVFFGHGSPMNALGGPYADGWRALGETIGKPRGVVMVSAHWETAGLAVTAQARPETIHDFGGFPDELHAMQYPAPGSPALASRIADLTGAVQTTQWGLDHWTWSVLAHVWPEADVPVVQLSLDRRLDAQGHLALARRLAPLRDEGVMIAGSGDFVHNLRTWKRSGGEPYAWAGQSRMDEITGGSPYGATTITGGDGSRMPSDNELEGARWQGRHVAETAKKLHG